MTQIPITTPNYAPTTPNYAPPTPNYAPTPNIFGLQPHYVHTSNPQGIWVVYYTNGHGEDTIPMTYYFEEIDALRDALDEPRAKVLFWKEGQPWLEAISEQSNQS